MEKNKTFFEKFKERRLQQTKQTVKKENVKLKALLDSETPKSTLEKVFNA
jgi:hypothetical protein